jgi:HEAT repeat protein
MRIVRSLWRSLTHFTFVEFLLVVTVVAIVIGFLLPGPDIRQNWGFAMEDDDPSVRAEAVGMLCKALKDRNSAVRRVAAFTLSLHGREAGPEIRAGVAALAEALSDRDVGVRGEAADALCWLAPEAESTVPALLATWGTRTEKFEWICCSP